MTRQASDHRFSPFVLDQYWIEGSGSNREVEQHLATCARCSAYVAALGGLAGEVGPSPVPASTWAAPASMPVAPSPPRRSAPRRWRAAWIFPSFAMAAALAFVIVIGRRPHDDSYVGQKGGASAQLLIKSAGEARVWDGVRPIRAGDAVALRVACAQFARVAVLTRSSSHQEWSAPIELACPGGERVLPFTLVADAAGQEEQIGIVLSRVTLEPSALARSLAEGRRSDSVAAFYFRVPK